MMNNHPLVSALFKMKYAMKWCVLLLFLITFQVASANRIQRAFNALNIYNYFEAKRLFEKIEPRNKPAGKYGLAIIYLRPDNPFHQLDSAYNKIVQCEAAFSLLNKNQVLKLERYGISLSTIQQLRLTISTYFFEQIMRAPTVELLDEFQKRHPWAREWLKSVSIRDSMAYFEAYKTGKSQAMSQFLTKYPLTIYHTLGEERFEWLQFKEETQIGNIKSYENFDTLFSLNRYHFSAQDSIYSLTTASNTIQSFEQFIRKYPTNRNYLGAWRSLYQKFVYEFTSDKLELFEERYPDYPFKDEIEIDRYYSKVKLLPCLHKGKYGWMDLNGNQVIESSYDAVGFFHEGLAWVNVDDKYGFVNKKNELIIPLLYSSASDFEDGRAVVEKNGKFALIDRVGDFLTGLNFEDLGQFDGELVYAKTDSLYGYVDGLGKMRIQPEFDEAYAFEHGIAKVVIDGKETLIDTVGKLLMAPIYEKLDVFSDSLFKCTSNNYIKLRYRYLDSLQPANYAAIGKLSGNLAIAIKQNALGYINSKGAEKIPFIYQRFPNDLKDGAFVGIYAKVSRGGKFGVIDTSGKEVIPCEYDQLGEISKIIGYRKDGKAGFISIPTAQVVPTIFNEVESLKDGRIIIRQNEWYGCMDEKGILRLPITFSSIKYLTTNMFLVSRKNVYGVLNDMGGAIVPLEYDRIQKLDDELLLLVKKDVIHYYHLPTNRLVVPNTN